MVGAGIPRLCGVDSYLAWLKEHANLCIPRLCGVDSVPLYLNVNCATGIPRLCGVVLTASE